MCGIVGIVQTQGAGLTEADHRVLFRQLDTLANRGPDASGHHFRHAIAFGHRRLAIRDIEQGQQPWLSPDGNCCLVYNGELYNDEELRLELSDQYEFRTQCDTEVVMAAYLRWGRRCVERFSGMFAFGLYDFRNSQLWLVRDRYGVKPLYYSQFADQFVFASHPSAILLHPKYSKQPDWRSVSHYLSTTRLTLGNRSLYRGINQLQPSEEMIVAGGKTETQQYWQYPTSQTRMPYEEAVELLETQLASSIKRRLVSDVPVGLFLSGGVDSCTIASLLNKIEPQSRHAFCACIESDHATSEDDELSHAKQCAGHVQADLQAIRVGSRMYMERWLELVQAFRLPLSTPSDVMIYEIAKAAKQHVGVVLGGEGADELLSGYETVSWSGNDYDATVQGNKPSNMSMLASIERQYGRSKFRNEADHYFALNSVVPMWAKSSVLQEPIFNAIEHDDAVFSHYQNIFELWEHLPTVEKYTRVLHRINLESLLARLDSTTMHAGLEARVPFTDHRLVESILQMPFNFRIDAQHADNSHQAASAELVAAGRIRSKRVLRDLAKSLLPANLAKRKKASFPTGVPHWLAKDWKQTISNYLQHSPFAKFLFAASFHNELVTSPEKAGMWLWPIANLSLWGDVEFFDRKIGC